jgi:hypothetical protein
VPCRRIIPTTFTAGTQRSRDRPVRLRWTFNSAGLQQPRQIELSAVALRNAAQRSRLKAMRAAEGSWRSSRQCVDEYHADRYATLR